MAETDVSKIVSLIMENPRLIEEIKSLSEQGEKKESANGTVDEGVEESNRATEPVSDGKRTRRGELLSALKPYVSKERGRAIDTMISIADILDMMKTR